MRRRESVSVLVADDDAVVRRMVAALLAKAGYEVLSATNGEEALAVAGAQRPQAIVLDIEMPKLDGYEVTRRLREDDRTSAIPVLLLTARSGDGDLADGFAAGSDDYLRKPFSGEELRTRVGALIERGRLIERLTAQTRTDALTELANRRGWEDELPRELSHSRRSEQPVAVAILDLDRFKRFNDEYGHLAGDSLLRELGATWPSYLREIDLIARWGGEEFALLLPNCRPGRAHAVVKRLRAAVPMGQTCSVGIAAWDGLETGERLMERADHALYLAKHRGRDRVELAPEAPAALASPAAHLPF
jgi:diguanylate cyclase (GGDEF)-like protein